jgi:hypothetical protein
MGRASALVLGLLWVGFLGVFDAAWLFRPEALRPLAEKALASIFVAPVRFEAVTGSWRGEFRFRRLAVARPEEPGADLVSAAEAWILLDWGALLSGRSPVREVRLLEPELDLAWLPGGGMRLLSPLRAESLDARLARLPRLRIDGLALRFRNAPFFAHADTRIRLESFAVELVPATHLGEGHYEFDARVRDPVAGEFRAFGALHGEDFQIQIRRSGFRTTEGLRELLQPGIAEFLARLQVGGGLEVHGTIARDPGTGRASYQARVHLDDAEIGYAGWPQSLQRLRGLVRYADGRLFTDGPLTGVLENAPITIRGSADLTGGTPVVEASGQVRDLFLTDALVERIRALPDPGPEVCRQLQSFRLRGPTDVSFKLGPKPGLALAPGFELVPEVRVEVKGCTLVYRGDPDLPPAESGGFPYPLDEVWGTVDLTDEVLRFEPLVARKGPTAVRAWGTVNYAKQGEETYSVHIWARGLPVEEQLLAALDPGTGAGVRALHPRGIVDVDVRTERTRDRLDAPETKVGVTLQGLRVEPESFPVPLENVRGHVEAQGPVIRLENVSAELAGALLRLSGTVGVEDQEGRLSLLVHGPEIEVGPKILDALAALPGSDLSGLRACEPAGRVGLDLALTREGQGKSLVAQGSLQLKKLRLTPPGMGLPIEDLEGWVELSTVGALPRLEASPGLRGRIAGAEFEVEKASFVPGLRHELRARAMEIEITPDRLAALAPLLGASPADLPEVHGLVRDLQVLGRGRDGSAPELRVQGGFSGVSLRLPTWTETRIVDLAGGFQVSSSGISFQDVMGRLERPPGLPLIPPELLGGTGALFGTTPGTEIYVETCGLSAGDPAGGLALSNLRLTGLPVEPWLLDLVGIPPAERSRAWLPSLTGFVDLAVAGAKLRRDRVLLTDGRVRLRSLHIGSGEDVFLEEGVLEDFFFALMPDGQASFRGQLAARNMRVLGLPLPRLEGRLIGDHAGFSILDIGGVLLGYEDDRFDPRLASRAALVARAESRAPRLAGGLDSRSDDELRALIERSESFDADRATREELVEHVIRFGLASRRRAHALDRAQLLALVRDARDLKPLGVVVTEGTQLAIDWSRGEMAVEGYFDRVSLPAALRHFGGDPRDLRGQLRARVSLGGRIGDPGSYQGQGRLEADAYNLLELPLFLGVVKSLDVFGLFGGQNRTRIDLLFEVRDRFLDFRSGSIVGRDLTLTVVPPSTLSFGGIVNARLDARHGNEMSIPLIGDILNLPASLLLGGLEIQGPVEDPRVTSRSLGFGAPTEVPGMGRRPVIKEPRGEQR